MFNSKKENLFEINKTSDKNVNSFIKGAKKESAKTQSENSALKYSTTGNDFVDQFGKIGGYRELRSFDSISTDMSVLWANDSLKATQFILYLRLITRTAMLPNGTKTSTVQRGAGLKHESIMRMIWLHINHSETFWKNIALFISAGSWKDIIQMLSYDLQYNGWANRTLDWARFVDLIYSGLENPDTSELLKKYLPQIKSNQKCTTIESQADNIIAKWISSFLFLGEDNKNLRYKKYRKLKSSGTAHEWQQLISQSNFNIDFDSVHGRALMQLVSGKFLENNNIEDKYEKWIESKPIAKFTGYPHELFGQYIGDYSFGISQKLNINKLYQKKTLIKQFDGLIETAKKDAKTDTSFIVVRDTSGSMGTVASGVNYSCNVIAKSLALFFGKMLPDGKFADSWIEFNSGAKLHQWKGLDIIEMWNNDNTNTISNTNFQSVIDLFVKLKATGIDESEFPTGILCLSDGEFDQSELEKTNVETALNKLRNVFSNDFVNNFKIVLWNIRRGWNGGNKFETYDEVKNVYYFSGYDGSVLSFLTGNKKQEKEPQTAEELFNAAMDQEILSLIEI